MNRITAIKIVHTPSGEFTNGTEYVFNGGGLDKFETGEVLEVVNTQSTNPGQIQSGLAYSLLVDGTAEVARISEGSNRLQEQSITQ